MGGCEGILVCMDQAEYEYFDMRLRLIEKLNEVRRTILSGDKNRMVQVLVELELYQKTFESLYEKRNNKHLERVA